MENDKKARKFISLCLVGCLLTSCASGVSGEDYLKYKSGDSVAAKEITEQRKFSSAFIHNGQEYQIYNLLLNNGRDNRVLVYVDGKLSYVNQITYSERYVMKTHPLDFKDYNFEGWMPMENGFDEVVASMSQNNMLSESYITDPDRPEDPSLVEYAVGAPFATAAVAAVAVIAAPFVPLVAIDEITSDNHYESELVSIPLGTNINDVNKLIGECELKLISRRSNYQICRYKLWNNRTAYYNTFAGYKDNKLIWKKVGSQNWSEDAYRAFYDYVSENNISGNDNKPFVAYAN